MRCPAAPTGSSTCAAGDPCMTRRSPGCTGCSPGSPVWSCRPPAPRDAAPAGPALAVLVPVRDGSSDLAGFLESAARVTDTVVALDDGSRDGSAAALAGSPLVRALIRTHRATGAWDDARNRQ